MTKEEFIVESTMRNMQSLLPAILNDTKDAAKTIENFANISIGIAEIIADKLYEKDYIRHIK